VMPGHLGVSMSHRHANVIRSIFHDPPSGNVHWRDVESVLRHVGAALEPKVQRV